MYADTGDFNCMIQFLFEWQTHGDWFDLFSNLSIYRLIDPSFCRICIKFISVFNLCITDLHKSPLIQLVVF